MIFPGKFWMNGQQLGKRLWTESFGFWVNCNTEKLAIGSFGYAR